MWPWNLLCLCQDRGGCCPGVNEHVPVQLQGEPAELRAPVPPSPAEPMAGCTSNTSELESKLAPGISDTGAVERAENVDDSGSKRDGVCG